jgi:hypothetical protein
LQSLDFNEFTSGKMKSRNVPGYEVDSLTIKVSFATNGANSVTALRSKERSGSRFSSSGVGTQIVTTEALLTIEKSVVALYAPLLIAAFNRSFDMSSTGLDPEFMKLTLASNLSIPITVQPASTAAIAKGSPT